MEGGSGGARLEVRRSDGRISVEGEIDTSNTDLFQRALADGSTGDRALLDMTGVVFMDSSALAVLLAAAAESEPGRPLVILPSAFVGRLLRITGLDGHQGIVVDGDRGSSTGSD